jgi:hypothetical protein
VADKKIKPTISRWSTAAAIFGGMCNLLCWIFVNYQFYYLKHSQPIWNYTFVFRGHFVGAVVSSVFPPPFRADNLHLCTRAILDFDWSCLLLSPILLVWNRCAILQDRYARTALGTFRRHFDGRRLGPSGDPFYRFHLSHAKTQRTRIMTLTGGPSPPVRRVGRRRNPSPYRLRTADYTLLAGGSLLTPPASRPAAR